MNKVLVASTKQMEGASDVPFFLEYYLIEENIVLESGIGICCYGIEIARRTGSFAQSETARSISCDKARVLGLVQALFRNSVTPLTLLDIVSDKLLEWETENDFSITTQQVV